MYQVCVHNKCKIPQEGLDMIRYHSFYAWHKDGQYSHFMSKEDEEKLKWIKLFSKYDLYTKNDDIPNVKDLKSYYQTLIEKYFPINILQW